MMLKKSTASRLCLLSVATLASLALSGCGVNSTVLPANTSVNALKGIVHGGPNPVIGATVTLYATTTSPYNATVGAALGTAVTDNNGSFTFVSPLACPSGQQAYVTAQGGNPGSGLNPNYLLVAALGPCSSVSSTTTIWISEATTIAAAYALRPFVTMTSVAGLPVVNIGAPANNNAATGACTLGGTNNTTTTGCVAAGLSHAFANALNLASSVSTYPAYPTGTIYTNTPSNPNGIIPVAMLNSLANSVEACTNSTGGVSGDGSACGNLFAATTVGTNTPTNIFQALLNVAQYPTLGSATNVTNLYNLASATSFYQPALTAAPTDYTLGIAYSGVNVANTVNSYNITTVGSGYTAIPTATISAPSSSGFNAAATVGLTLVGLTVTTQPSTCSATSGTVKFANGTSSQASAASWTYTVGATPALVVTVTTYGIGITAGPPTATITNCTGAVLTPIYGVGDLVATTVGTSYTSAPTVTINCTCTPTVPAVVTANLGFTPVAASYALGLDANDNVYIASQNQNGGNGAYGFNSGISSNGTTIYTTPDYPANGYNAPRVVAPDTLGNVWVSSVNSGTSGIQRFTALSGALASTYSTTTAANPSYGLAIDLQNNVWYGISQASASPKLFELQLSGTSTYTNYTFTNPPVPTYQIHSIAIDANQNIYIGQTNASADTVAVLPNLGTAAAPSYNGNVINSATLSGTASLGIALDASDNIWQPANGGFLNEIVPTFSGPTVTALNAATTSPYAFAATTPESVEVDGAGNVWMSSQLAGENVIEFTPSTSVSTTYNPCYSSPAGATTCATHFNKITQLAIDSTGALWITNSANAAHVVQLIGPGYPTWPQLSLGQPGLPPQ